MKGVFTPACDRGRDWVDKNALQLSNKQPSWAYSTYTNDVIQYRQDKII